jgi:seryl-tRNA synthetase
MLDKKYIFENIELVKENCINRGISIDFDLFIELETLRRSYQIQVDYLNGQINENTYVFNTLKDLDGKDNCIKNGHFLREKLTDVKIKLNSVVKELDEICLLIPNMTHSDVSIERVIKRFGKTFVPVFDFEPKNHVEIAENLDLVDFEGGSRVAGSGFYFLKNEAVLLELALQRYAVDILVKAGFIPTITPDVARNEVLQGIGFNPRGNETQIYSIENTDLSLVATAEIPLGGLLAGKVIESDKLPLKFCGISHCFRTEAGAAGKASKGLFRVHQFTKIEMFAFTLPNQSEAMHHEMLEIQQQIFDGLAIPYRIVDIPLNDLGNPAYRKYDIEAWMPGRDSYGEITSTSNCTDYQARRLNARYKVKGEKGTHFLHTLNGTAIAISRALVAILELYQQADGSVCIPDVLKSYIGIDVIHRKK